MSGSRSPDPTEPWEETSYAIFDADRESIVNLARRHGQTAIVEWASEYRAIVLCGKADVAHDQAIIPTGRTATWM